MNINLQAPIWAIEHVAEALFLSVDAAREHTYRHDFPAPAATFSKNLWLPEDVLVWFAALPKRTAAQEGRRNTTRATGKNAATTPVSEVKVSSYKPRKDAR